MQTVQHCTVRGPSCQSHTHIFRPSRGDFSATATRNNLSRYPMNSKGCDFTYLQHPNLLDLVVLQVRTSVTNLSWPGTALYHWPRPTLYGSRWSHQSVDWMEWFSTGGNSGGLKKFCQLLHGGVVDGHENNNNILGPNWTGFGVDQTDWKVYLFLLFLSSCHCIQWCMWNTNVHIACLTISRTELSHPSYIESGLQSSH